MTKPVKHIGYKAFDKDLKCRGFQYKVGKTYVHTEAMKMCAKGFHFCKKLKDVFNYYPKDNNTRVCEIVAEDIVTEGDKSVTNTITILREISKEEINSGDYNSGHYNSGDCNSGHYNSGHYNSGKYNSGHYNSGNHNSGDCNSGHYNSGKYNSGHYNSGKYNSGHYNSGNHNSGYFNTTTPKVRLFNKDTDLEFNDKRIQKLLSLNVLPILQWISERNMNEEEKKNNPSYKTCQGYLKNTGRNDYSKLTKENKELILSLPGFDDTIFKAITGVSLLEEETIEVTINGVTKSISKKKAKELGLIEE